MSNVLDPLEILQNKGERRPNFLHNTINPILCTAAGFGLGIVLNWGFRKPAFSGIQKHIGLALVGGALGTVIDRKRTEHLAERDAVLRHYIELHREDFPPVERKKYADVLEAWVPIR